MQDNLNNNFENQVERENDYQSQSVKAKKYTFIKILQCLSLIVGAICVAIGFSDFLAKDLGIISYVLFGLVFASVPLAISFVLAVVGIVACITEYKKTKLPETKKTLIYFIVMAIIVLLVFFVPFIVVKVMAKA